MIFAISVALAQSFTVCKDDQPTCLDTQGFYRNDLKVDGQPFKGIAISSKLPADNVLLFVEGFSGKGTYRLKGTTTSVWASASNAVASVDRHAYWVCPEDNTDSEVVVTSVEGGLISGTYRATVYFQGKSNEPRMRLRGEFKNVPMSNK